MAPDGRSIYESADAVFQRDGNAEYYLDETNVDAADAKARLVRRYWDGPGRLLDVGASFGHFLEAIGDSCDARGVENLSGGGRVEHPAIGRSERSGIGVPAALVGGRPL